MNLQDIELFAEKYNMLPSGSKILAAVSGGADSMCMLTVLSQLGEKHGFSVAAATFDHKLRGESSYRDAEFVREFCRERAIECKSGAGDVAGFAAHAGLGAEEAARIMRYSFLEEAREAVGALYIATAHNADDNAETVIMALARGAGLRGACGIPPVRGNVIRPLLPFSKAEILSYLEKHGVPHVEDASNDSDEYTRNRIRHTIMPILREINPAASANIFSATQLMRADDTLLCTLAEAFIEEFCTDAAAPVKGLGALPAPIASRVIRSMCGIEAASGHVDAVLRLCAGSSPSASVDIAGMTVRREYDRVIFGSSDCGSDFASVEARMGEDVEIPELLLTVRSEKAVFGGKIHKSFTSFPFKMTSVCGNIIVRPRTSGDSITLAGRGVTKTLKKLFIENKIPSAARGLVPVLADDNGPLGVYGMGMDERAAPQAGDEIVLVSLDKTPPQ